MHLAQVLPSVASDSSQVARVAMPVLDVHPVPLSTMSAQRRQRHKNCATKHLECDVADLKSRLSLLELLVVKPVVHQSSQPDEELSPSREFVHTYSRTELLHFSELLNEETVCKKLCYETEDVDVPTSLETSPLQEVYDNLDALLEGLCQRLYSEDLYIASSNCCEQSQYQCQQDESPPCLPPDSSYFIDDPLFVQHESMKHNLLMNMFKVDDFLLWKKRGYSDAEAHNSVQDRFDDGYVVWKDGGLQYIEDDGDEEFGCESSDNG